MCFLELESSIFNETRKESRAKCCGELFCNRDLCNQARESIGCVCGPRLRGCSAAGINNLFINLVAFQKSFLGTELKEIVSLPLSPFSFATNYKCGVPSDLCMCIYICAQTNACRERANWWVEGPRIEVSYKRMH